MHEPHGMPGPTRRGTRKNARTHWTSLAYGLPGRTHRPGRTGRPGVLPRSEGAARRPRGGHGGEAVVVGEHDTITTLHGGQRGHLVPLTLTVWQGCQAYGGCAMEVKEGGLETVDHWGCLPTSVVSD